MKKVEEILELLKGKPYSVEGLKVYSKLSEEKLQEIVSFMKKSGFIEVNSNGVTITDAGLEFLKVDSEGTKVLSLYSETAKKASAKERENMADRFGVETDDIDYAAWAIAKDMVWAKLRRDLEERRENGR